MSFQNRGRGRQPRGRRPFRGGGNFASTQPNPQSRRGSQSMNNLSTQQGPYYNNIPFYQESPPPLLGIPPPYQQFKQPVRKERRAFPSPPPSYTEVEKTTMKKIKADAIVKALSLFKGQFASAETIGKHIEGDKKDIEAVVKANSKIFSTMKDGNQLMIELVPKISICMEYLSDEGCGSRNTCKNLHICKYFIVSSCSLGFDCQFGHKWDTSHNSKVLSVFYLDLIDKQVLREVMRKTCRQLVPPQICRFYNSKNGCKHGERCGQLHICRDFVKSAGKCSCTSYSHDIVIPQCRRILQKHDISVNESPRDIIMALKAALAKGDVTDKPVLSNENKNKDDISETNQKGVKPKKKTNNDNKTNAITHRSTDLLGDIKIPEICIFNVEGRCKNEKQGCDYLHAGSLFHWQAEKDQHWYNFRVPQSKVLENAFRDVAKGSVTLPPLDEHKVADNVKDLLLVFGTEPWIADLQSMNIDSKSNRECLKIRRISTKSAAESTHPKATVYQWYFMDEQNKWVQYGKIDSLGKQEFICSITSEEIEKQYILDPSSYIEFSNSRYQYKLDFVKMKQINADTGKTRDVRRRPTGLSYQKSVLDKEAALPSIWSPMVSNQTHFLHSLDANTTEYNDIVKLLRMSLPSVNIVKVQRLQNPYLWRLFHYKQVDLKRRYGENQLNVQRLFYSVDLQNIDTICKENFDWRQEKNNTQEFGKGAYFFNRAAVTRKYCVPDSQGKLYMFVAQVIVGSVVKGTPELTRPPMNHHLKALYDTTVDDEQDTTIFVKYDKEDYYPEYLVEFY